MSNDLNVAGQTENTQSEVVATNPPMNADATAQAPVEQAQAVDSTLLDESEQESQEAQEQPQTTVEEVKGAPEKYDEFKAPEGVSLNAEIVKAYSDVARELNLPQEKAQSVIDKLAPELAKQQKIQFETINKEWRSKAENDPEIGGEHLKATLSSCRKALKEFRGADGKFLDADVAEFTAMAGNHPGLIKMLRHFGSRLGEDRSPGIKTVGGKPVFTPADFYKMNRS